VLRLVPFQRTLGDPSSRVIVLLTVTSFKSKRDFRTATEPIAENILERIFLFSFLLFLFITFFNFQRVKEEEEEEKNDY
jgi:hypothetical protein